MNKYFRTKTGWNLTRKGTELFQNDTLVMRFTCPRPVHACTESMRILAMNFTPDEYFAARAAGKSHDSILEAKLGDNAFLWH